MAEVRWIRKLSPIWRILRTRCQSQRFSNAYLLHEPKGIFRYFSRESGCLDKAILEFPRLLSRFFSWMLNRRFSAVPKLVCPCPCSVQTKGQKQKKHESNTSQDIWLTNNRPTVLKAPLDRDTALSHSRGSGDIPVQITRKQYEPLRIHMVTRGHQWCVHVGTLARREFCDHLPWNQAFALAYLGISLVHICSRQSLVHIIWLGQEDEHQQWFR